MYTKKGEEKTHNHTIN